MRQSEGRGVLHEGPYGRPMMAVAEEKIVIVLCIDVEEEEFST
jgi:hypothetical protein